jgi:NADPH oxidase 5
MNFILSLRENPRSESETSFDSKKMNMAQDQVRSLEKAYNSPQNKAIAQSFRYMRNKPTIIAFKTPSLEAYESSKVADKGKRKKFVRRFLIINILDGNLDISKAAEEGKAHVAVNFPVGKPLEIFIDGPYGAPSSHIFRAQHAVLIGTGIGVTPFASILQSIMHRYWKGEPMTAQRK